jgi:hypothetical protein
VRFFFDNNLPPKLAKSLHVLVEPDHQVVHLKDRFAANTTDETWMVALAKEQGWIIVSGNLQIRKNPHEVHAWRAAGHTTFFLKAGWINLPFWIQAWKFVKCFPEIIVAADHAKKGSFFSVSTKGKIEK